MQFNFKTFKFMYFDANRTLLSNKTQKAYQL